MFSFEEHLREHSDSELPSILLDMGPYSFSSFGYLVSVKPKTLKNFRALNVATYAAYSSCSLIRGIQSTPNDSQFADAALAPGIAAASRVSFLDRASESHCFALV